MNIVERVVGGNVEGVAVDVENVNFKGVEDDTGNLNVERSGTIGLTPTTVDLIKIICTKIKSWYVQITLVILLVVESRN